jgi:hypothetical protein
LETEAYLLREKILSPLTKFSEKPFEKKLVIFCFSIKLVAFITVNISAVFSTFLQL